MDAVAHRHINTSSDSELLLNIFADHLNETGKFRINEEDIFVAVRGLMTQARGAYACVAMLAGFGIIAFRDPNGIRPLGVARRPTPDGAADWLCASESAAADVGGFVDWEDVRPGTLSTGCLLVTHRAERDARRSNNTDALWRVAAASRPRGNLRAGHLRVCLPCAAGFSPRRDQRVP